MQHYASLQKHCKRIIIIISDTALTLTHQKDIHLIYSKVRSIQFPTIKVKKSLYSVVPQALTSHQRVIGGGA